MSIRAEISKRFHLALPQAKDKARGDTWMYLPPAAPEVGNKHVELKYSESDLLAQPHIYPGAARHERETRIAAPYLGTEDIAVRVDVGVTV